ncbi:5'-nucleotidase C-terminal domain-containing protein [Pseudodesulfovibrio sp. S3]|uniref:bifunctional metallophosphatase/5'-nucleotidase n=2 Tax=unclassified Pseudodesulfovibrio TaxID=2661612 RepID=UPI000FEC09FC|nr:5'-nucleotidase C-terminal domain-containing protein [Pseudodesulfovibrio sp. S3]MCJ2164404.1 5'-nucleotidase C-terminal domain-containing protein [Pseudodesulfovibrio sp. S3-i]RWU04610.1 bifunctional NAD pyrophosphatase/5'-nucleotidase [Pseudodesulfovibrio sp. S3]
MFKMMSSCLLALVIALGPQCALAFDLTVLHVNDSHSYLDATGDKLAPGGASTYVQTGGWARLQTAVDDVRGKRTNVVLLHAGDAVQGDLYFMKYGGKPEMELLDRLGFAAMTLGNHEFDKGADFLAGFLKYTKVPILCANMDASAVPALAARVKPYVVTEFQGEKVGIIGLTIEETATISSPGKVTFADEAKTALKYVRELEALGVNKIILLTHVGLETDKKLAASVPGVDVIVGGHSHSLLGGSEVLGALGLHPEADYPVVVKGADGNDVYVVTAWKWGRILGRLDVTFDDQGHATAARGKPVLILADTFKRKNEAGRKAELAGAPREELLALIKANPMAEVVVADSGATTFLGPFSEGVDAMRNDVIGTAAATLTHIRVPGLTDSGESLPHGSLIAPIVCQSMLAKLGTTKEPADIALMNAGGVRDSVSQGNITVGTAYTLMPFNNTLILLTLTGAQVKTALETGVTRSGGAFPYMSGARYTADMNRAEGERITDVEVLGRDGKWAGLDPARSYRLVTNSFLASGGDGYEVMKQATSSYDTGFVDAEAFIEYVQKEKTLTPLAAYGVTYIPAR